MAKTPFWSGALFIASFLVGCVGTELEVPANHPASPEARPGKVILSTALGPELDLRVDQNDVDQAPAGHAGHQHGPENAPESSPPPSTPSSAGETAPSQQTPDSTTYTCPMHPEIVRKEPGNCPICGMKLVPKKVEK